MQAPDKIYVFQHGINAFDALWHFTESKEKYWESHEYIRKDALLEWAKEKQYESLTIVADNFWQEVIDKLNSL